jgi:hypothetical protein
MIKPRPAQPTVKFIDDYCESYRRQFDGSYKMAGGKAANPLGPKSSEGFLGRYV